MHVLDAFRDAAGEGREAGTISRLFVTFCASLSLLDKILHAPLE